MDHDTNVNERHQAEAAKLRTEVEELLRQAKVLLHGPQDPEKPQRLYAGNNVKAAAREREMVTALEKCDWYRRDMKRLQRDLDGCFGPMTRDPMELQNLLTEKRKELQRLKKNGEGLDKIAEAQRRGEKDQSAVNPELEEKLRFVKGEVEHQRRLNIRLQGERLKVSEARQQAEEAVRAASGELRSKAAELRRPAAGPAAGPSERPGGRHTGDPKILEQLRRDSDILREAIKRDERRFRTAEQAESREVEYARVQAEAARSQVAAARQSAGSQQADVTCAAKQGEASRQNAELARLREVPTDPSKLRSQNSAADSARLTEEPREPRVCQLDGGGQACAELTESPLAVAVDEEALRIEQPQVLADPLQLDNAASSDPPESEVEQVHGGEEASAEPTASSPTAAEPVGALGIEQPQVLADPPQLEDAASNDPPESEVEQVDGGDQASAEPTTSPPIAAEPVGALSIEQPQVPADQSAEQPSESLVDQADGGGQAPVELLESPTVAAAFEVPQVHAEAADATERQRESQVGQMDGGGQAFEVLADSPPSVDVVVAAWDFIEVGVDPSTGPSMESQLGQLDRDCQASAAELTQARSVADPTAGAATDTASGTLIDRAAGTATGTAAAAGSDEASRLDQCPPDGAAPEDVVSGDAPANPAV
jgi:hypothetical protein